MEGPAFDWLSERNVTGTTAKRVVAELSRSGISQSQIPGVLSSMGDAGLEALVASMEREQAARAGVDAPVVELTVSVPKERHSFTLRGRAGDNLHNLVVDADAETGGEELAMYLECACGGVAACSTCHVLLEPAAFAAAGDVTNAEQDMLDLAFGYEEDGSRLGCQLKLSEAMDGTTMRLPEGVHNYF